MTKVTTTFCEDWVKEIHVVCDMNDVIVRILLSEK